MGCGDPQDRWWSTTQAAAAAGVSPRQADYWVRTGRLREPNGKTCGSGTLRRWHIRDVVALWVYGQLWADGDGNQMQDLRAVQDQTIRACYTQTGNWLFVGPDQVAMTDDAESVITVFLSRTGVFSVLPVAWFVVALTGAFPVEDLGHGRLVDEILGPAIHEDC